MDTTERSLGVQIVFRPLLSAFIRVQTLYCSFGTFM